MEQLVIAPPPPGSFGALLRACRHRACLSQEQLAARAEVSERTVRNLEAGRVRSPHNDTVRLLADALQLDGPERGNWFAAARGVNHQRAGPAAPGAGAPAPLPGDGPAQLQRVSEQPHSIVVRRAHPAGLKVAHGALAHFGAGRQLLLRQASPVPARPQERAEGARRGGAQVLHILSSAAARDKR